MSMNGNAAPCLQASWERHEATAYRIGKGAKTQLCKHSLGALQFAFFNKPFQTSFAQLSGRPTVPSRTLKTPRLPFTRQLIRSIKQPKDESNKDAQSPFECNNRIEGSNSIFVQ
jgi:hypothetical protein